MVNSFDSVVVGGGFFGTCLALELRKEGKRVLLLEREPELMARASLNNQARVHGGYHYPRSFTTASRSRANYRRFIEDFSFAVDQRFKKYYAIAKVRSHVSARQFETFCQRIDAPLIPASKAVRAWFDRNLVETVYEVEECAFDATILREWARRQLDEYGVVVRTGTFATRILGAGKVERVEIGSPGTETVESVGCSEALVCAYAQINGLLSRSGHPLIPMKYELAEMPLVEAPTTLGLDGVTLMCGPFFSMMPYPAGRAHSLSHVRYTPHFSWTDSESPELAGLLTEELANQSRSRFTEMLLDSARYMPSIKLTKYIKSLWEIKTILPRNEHNDGRPILFKANHGLRNLTCVLGGKIDNMYEVVAALRKERPLG